MHCHASLCWVLGHINAAKSNLNTVTIDKYMWQNYKTQWMGEKQMFYNTALSSKLYEILNLFNLIGYPVKNWVCIEIIIKLN